MADSDPATRLPKPIGALVRNGKIVVLASSNDIHIDESYTDGKDVHVMSVMNELGEEDGGCRAHRMMSDKIAVIADKNGMACVCIDSGERMTIVMSVDGIESSIRCAWAGDTIALTPVMVGSCGDCLTSVDVVVSKGVILDLTSSDVGDSSYGIESVSSIGGTDTSLVPLVVGHDSYVTVSIDPVHGMICSASDVNTGSGLLSVLNSSNNEGIVAPHCLISRSCNCAINGCHIAAECVGHKTGPPASNDLV